MPSSKDSFVSAQEIDSDQPDILITPNMAATLRRELAQKSTRLTYLKHGTRRPILTIDGEAVEIPAEGYESRLCEVLFRNGKPVSKVFSRKQIRTRWDSINPEFYELRSVSDAARRLNDRVKRDTTCREPLVSPAGKSIGLNRFYLG
ncbi:MAG TPA: hypothetical protein VK712_04440 [Verrucomicrobiae bacterium]|jgi:hypothetical protein|nr:hypothetical protein [Verrucomicrobiae bacterium]